MQISNYADDKTQYLVLSSATADPFREKQYRSISVGLLINRQLKRKIQFLADKKIKRRDVGVTCERCSILDCKERMAPSTSLVKETKDLKIAQVVDELSEKFDA